MKYLILASLILCGCADNSQVNVQGDVKIDTVSQKTALVDIGEFEVLYVYTKSKNEVETLEPVSVMQGERVVRDWYIDQSYINDSVRVINGELVK